FWARLLYFGYDTNLGHGWSAAVGFEMNSPAYEKETMVPYVKSAYIRKALGKGAQLLIGIIPTPSFDKTEGFWGLRYIEKTATDLFQFAAPRDFGIALEGKTGNGLVYNLTYGNYGSIEGEWNKGKAIYGRIGWESESHYLEANGHYAKDGRNKITFLSVFGGLKGSWGRFGIGYHYKNMKPGASDSVNNSIISTFAVVNAGEKIQAFVRYDHNTDFNFENIGGYLPNPAADYKSRLLVVGTAYKVSEMIRICPNLKYVFYGESGIGEKPGGD
ncbi:MAG: hypothetical protein GY940_25885, partial [bacterium]|nr:hypothetical protein [bacterium]